MRTWLLGTVVAACVSCVAGYRGEADFEGEASLEGVRTLRIEAPSSPVPLSGILGQDRVWFQGIARGVGGTKSEAEAAARSVGLDTELYEGFRRMSLSPSFDFRGLVDVEILDVQVPPELDLEVQTGRGDVEIRGMTGLVSVDTARGEVDLEAGEGAVEVVVDDGPVSVVAAGDVEIRTGRGDVFVRQSGETARRLFTRTAAGDVVIELASDENVDLTVYAPGSIEVATPQIVARGRGVLRRSVGSGEVEVQVRTGLGRVRVTTVTPPA